MSPEVLEGDQTDLSQWCSDFLDVLSARICNARSHRMRKLFRINKLGLSDGAYRLELLDILVHSHLRTGLLHSGEKTLLVEQVIHRRRSTFQIAQVAGLSEMDHGKH